MYTINTESKKAEYLYYDNCFLYPNDGLIEKEYPNYVVLKDNGLKVINYKTNEIKKYTQNDNFDFLTANTGYILIRNKNKIEIIDIRNNSKEILENMTSKCSNYTLTLEGQWGQISDEKEQKINQERVLYHIVCQ